MIYTYHKVSLEAKTFWWVDVNNFYRQMVELKGKKVVYLDDYDYNDTSQVVITFDGVYECVIDYAVPILRRFGYPFELFITSSYMGDTNAFDEPEPLANFAGLDSLRYAIANGGRLQWHTKTHANISNISNISNIVDELSIPKYIYDIDNSGFKWFAYPYGVKTDIAEAYVKERFTGAVLCDDGLENDIYALKRVSVSNQHKLTSESVSVVIVSYNYGDYLAEAVESVLQQTFPPDEIIILNDGSQDSTEEVALACVEMHNKIKYYANDRNIGIVATFNRGLALASSTLISFLGADNMYQPTFLEETVSALLINNNVSIAYTDFAMFGKRASVMYDQLPFKGKIIRDKFFLSNFPKFTSASREIFFTNNFIHGSSLYRKNVAMQVNGYHESDSAEDHELFVKIISNKGSAIKVGNSALLLYRQHSEGQTNSVLSLRAQLRIYKKILKHTRVDDYVNKAVIKILPFNSIQRKFVNYMIGKILILLKIWR